ncbi:hypothetical protein Tsubulata_013931 [Turnera subulata]|uniref:Zinc knuckle CX2CX4HX4C domain-containing protein n=1 Tax=Turnera subulata TaxID=218843 RepID=A0A9Q0FYT6_9ROSI|nr:hypothetical protein Tsubulata_013931 [Turnera subulata]
MASSGGVPRRCDAGPMAMADGEEVWVYFEYERLPWFYFHCGCMGHVARDCSTVNDDDLQNPLLFQYGDELRASPLRRNRFSQGPRLTGEKVKRKLVFKPGRDKVDNRVEARLEVTDHISMVSPQSLRPETGKARQDAWNGGFARGGSPDVLPVHNPIDSPLGKIIAKVQGFGLHEVEVTVGKGSLSKNTLTTPQTATDSEKLLSEVPILTKSNPIMTNMTIPGSHPPGFPLKPSPPLTQIPHIPDYNKPSSPPPTLTPKDTSLSHRLPEPSDLVNDLKE